MTNDDGGDSNIDLAALSQRLESINRVVRNTAAQAKSDSAPAAAQLSPDTADANTIATAISSSEDTSSAASDPAESKGPALDELSLDDEENDENRNKR